MAAQFHIIIAFLAVAVGGVGLTMAIFHLVLARESRDWPRAVAVIVRSAIAEVETGDGTGYRAEIAYRYTVDGREIVASRIRIPEPASWSWRGPAAKLSRRYPAGKSVTVAYDPVDPAQGVLEPGATSTAWGITIFFAIWTAGSIYLLVNTLGGSPTT